MITAQIDEKRKKELIAELFGGACEDKTRVSCPHDIVPILLPWANLEQEEFIVILLNGAHSVIGEPISVTRGLLNRTVVHPREVFRPAIAANCAAVIVAHNHPSGTHVPSPEDKEITMRLKKAGEIIGIPVLDHVIISNSGYCSFLELGEM